MEALEFQCQLFVYKRNLPVEGSFIIQAAKGQQA